MGKILIVYNLFIVTSIISANSIVSPEQSVDTLFDQGYVVHDKKFIVYSEYGAIGDGITDDFEAIIKAHAAANEAGLPVRAEAGKTYFIGDVRGTAHIQTDTDWTGAFFIIDDSKVKVYRQNNQQQVFQVSSKLPSFQISAVNTIKKNQNKLDLLLPQDCFIDVTDNTTRRYIRYGPDQNSGSIQNDQFIVYKNGNVDKETPVVWNFETISSMTAYPIDTKTLTIKGGHFTTIANQIETQGDYFNRGIKIIRSHVVVDGIYHVVTGELDYGAPYYGFLEISRCTNILVQNSAFSGHSRAASGSRDGKGRMGTYDISVSKANNVTFKNCKQINSIHDTRFWGIIQSNFSKNLTFDHVTFSRFDAHQGVTNATIKNSELGHQGIELIGQGVFLMENTKVYSGIYGSNFIHLREDYGSTFEGEIIVRNCEFIPRNGLLSDVFLIKCQNHGFRLFSDSPFLKRGHPSMLNDRVLIAS